jgi:hypothetical protein
MRDLGMPEFDEMAALTLTETVGDGAEAVGSK